MIYNWLTSKNLYNKTLNIELKQLVSQSSLKPLNYVLLTNYSPLYVLNCILFSSSIPTWYSKNASHWFKKWWFNKWWFKNASRSLSPAAYGDTLFKHQNYLKTSIQNVQQLSVVWSKWSQESRTKSSWELITNWNENWYQMVSKLINSSY